MSSPASAAAKPLAIVTGSSRGLGLAIATKLHEKGFDVAGIARSDPSPAQKKCLSHCYKCDLSQPEQLETLFHSSLKKELKCRDRIVLVNNAGSLDPIGPTSLFGDDAMGAVASLDATIRLNVTSPIWLSGAVLREADAEAAVRIINISSGAADNAYPGWNAYCSSKAALRMSGQVLAVDASEFDELKGRDVRVFDYAPVSRLKIMLYASLIHSCIAHHHSLTCTVLIFALCLVFIFRLSAFKGCC